MGEGWGGVDKQNIRHQPFACADTGVTDRPSCSLHAPVAIFFDALLTLAH